MSLRRNIVFGWALAAVLSAGFAALGAWQYTRAGGKQATLDAAATALDTRAPAPLAAAVDPAAGDRHAWAAGGGGFADVPPVLLDNQQRGGRAGVRAYRVFVPDTGTPLLVDLGWLPLPGDRALPAVPRPPATRVSGLLSPPPSPGLAAPTAVAQPGGQVLATGLDMAALAPLVGQPALAPRVLRLDPALPYGHARDLEILANTLPPERHLGYAVQWWALALAVLVVAAVLTVRATRTPRAPRPRPPRRR